MYDTIARLLSHLIPKSLIHMSPRNDRPLGCARRNLQAANEVTVGQSCFQPVRFESLDERLREDPAATILSLVLPSELSLLTCCQNDVRGHIRTPIPIMYTVIVLQTLQSCMCSIEHVFN